MKKRKAVPTRLLAKALALLLAITFLLLAVPLLSERAEALDYTDIESKLNTWQYYFCRTIMSLSLKDSYDTGVLASITAGQSFYEGGCAGAPISIIAQNHFGIKAYSNWEGKVYDDNTYVIYNSYSDLVNIMGESYAKSASLWRAYDTWEEGVADHSALLLGESKYAPVLAAKTYQEAAPALVAAGYCSSSTYAANLIGFIERYGFDQLDDVTTDENGVFGMIMDHSRIELSVGDTFSLDAQAYPSPASAVSVVWKSDRPEVASVDQNGKVTAHKQGYTLITATYNGKEACCVVCVDANAYVMNRNLAVYSRPDVDSDSLGRLDRGQPVKINSATVYTAEDGTKFYAVSASVGSGTIVSGYAAAADIYAGSEVRLSIGTPKTILYLEEGDEQTIPVEVYAEELQDKQLIWASSDPSVVSVEQDGSIRALTEGVSVISVSIDDTVALTVTVYVGDAAYEVLVANAAVYLRAGPASGASILGTIAKGQEVKLVNEPENGWYRILAVINGKTMEGYSYSRYFNKPGEESNGSDDSSGSSAGTSSTPSGTTSSDPTSGDTSSGSGTVVVTYKTGQVNVDDALNVRDTPGTDGSRIARLGNKTEVILLEDVIHVSSETVYKDWYHISFTYNGKSMDGYVAAEFIILTGTVDVPIQGVQPPVSATYTIETDYVVGIPAEMTLAAFTEVFEHSVRLFRADGSELSDDDILQTGDQIRFYIGSTVIYSRFAVVCGDANGDGKVDARDYMMAKRAVLETYELSGAFLRAAAVGGGDNVSATDYMKIKRVVLGTYQF